MQETIYVIYTDSSDGLWLDWAGANAAAAKRAWKKTLHPFLMGFPDDICNEIFARVTLDHDECELLIQASAGTVEEDDIEDLLTKVSNMVDNNDPGAYMINCINGEENFEFMQWLADRLGIPVDDVDEFIDPESSKWQDALKIYIRDHIR